MNVPRSESSGGLNESAADLIRQVRDEDDLRHPAVPGSGPQPPVQHVVTAGLGGVRQAWEQAGVCGADRVGVRLSPTGGYNDMSDSDPLATFGYAAGALGRFGLADEVAPTAVLLASEPGGNLFVGQTLGRNSGDVMP